MEKVPLSYEAARAVFPHNKSMGISEVWAQLSRKRLNEISWKFCDSRSIPRDIDQGFIPPHFWFCWSLAYGVLLCPENDSGIVQPIRSTVPEVLPRTILIRHAAWLFLKALISKAAKYNAVTSTPSWPQCTYLAAHWNVRISKILNLEIFYDIIHFCF